MSGQAGQRGQIAVPDIRGDLGGLLIVVDVGGDIAGLQHLKPYLFTGKETGGIGGLQDLLGKDDAAHVRPLIGHVVPQGLPRQLEGKLEALDHAVPDHGGAGVAGKDVQGLPEPVHRLTEMFDLGQHQWYTILFNIL